MENKIIGQLIENEVRRQQLNMVEFAKRIHCERANVYKIFKRNNIDIQLLANISRVLNYNFFEEIAKNYSLADEPSEETEKQTYELNAVSNFLQFVPEVLKEMGKEPLIIGGAKELLEGRDELPDFGLPKYALTFTIGNTWTEKTNAYTNPLFIIEPFPDAKDIKFYSIVNRTIGTRMIDIKIDLKSKEEWRELIQLVFTTFPDQRFQL